MRGPCASARRNVTQACVANWYEGWAPNEADVRNLVDVVRATITLEEHILREGVIADADHVARGQLC
jgi:hypothetical protein